jgi:hypothetical protein
VRRAAGRRLRAQRSRIFFAGEGESEQAFGRWLHDVCDHRALDLHLDVHLLGGGGPLSMVQTALRLRQRGTARGAYVYSLVLLDGDRMDHRDTRAADARRLARQHGLVLILQQPNHEGLLVRLLGGRPVGVLSPSEAAHELRRLWPGYDKPATRRELRSRLSLAHLEEAARHDREILRLLQTIRLA